MSEFKLSYTAQEIDNKLSKIDDLALKSEIPTAINDALVEAKENGMFDSPISIIDDGQGNVTIATDSSITITDDGNGNVIIK